MIVKNHLNNSIACDTGCLQISISSCGWVFCLCLQVVSHELIPGGCGIPVTAENRCVIIIVIVSTLIV